MQLAQKPSRAALAQPSAKATCRPATSTPLVARRAPTAVVCSSQKDGQDQPSLAQRFALPAAAVLGAALLFAATPDDALAARSGGRVGGSGFSRRSAPMPRGGGGGGGIGSVRNYNTYVAPPIISPYGGFGYGFGGGVGIMPFPIFGLGAVFNIIIIMFVLNVVLNTIRNFTSGGDSKKDDRWDDDKDEKW